MQKNDISYFITTTLPYANSTPHVGHCLEFVQADALSRYFKQKHDTFLNIGLDEHGLKIYQAAVKENISPDKFVDQIFVKWQEFVKLFNIEYTSFYRTSDYQHHLNVQAYWQDLLNKGDIYKKNYVGKYCIGCEEFKPESQLVNDKCELHSSLEIQEIAEENWFLKLTKYRDQILEYVQTHREFLKPFSKRNELLNLIKDTEDLSISRRRDMLPWGVAVPNDDTQTIYVWFEALLNYLFACNEKNNWNNEKFERTITVQLCGPDNLKFQALIWQGILLANNNKHSDHILVHGTILDENGQKMSKSLGNVIDPVTEVQKYGLDAVRYYILKGLHTYQNSNWSSKDLVETYNADLANNFGNLLARTLHLIDKNNVTIEKPEDWFVNEVFDYSKEIIKHWNNFEISQALERTQAFVTFGNKYINEQQPWSNLDILPQCLSNLYYLLKLATDLYEPAIPNAVAKIKIALKEQKKAIIFERKK